MNLTNGNHTITIEFKPNAVWIGCFVTKYDVVFRIDKNVLHLNPLVLQYRLGNYEGITTDAITGLEPTSETTTYTFVEHSKREVACKVFSMEKGEFSNSQRLAFEKDEDIRDVISVLKDKFDLRGEIHPYINGIDYSDHEDLDDDENSIDGWITSVVVYVR